MILNSEFHRGDVGRECELLLIHSQCETEEL